MTHVDNETDARVLDNLPNRFRLERTLGVGGFGSVHLAFDQELGRRVAIKSLTALTDVSATRSALRAEARALAAVTHPHVVGVLDVISMPSVDVLVLEFVSGGSLKDVLATGRVPERGDALHWIAGMASGLAAVHAAGLLHCDLKPDNVLLDAGRRARIADFGLAHVARGPSDAMNRGGSIGYVAPEVVLGEPHSVVSDLYGLGIVAWELLAGRRAFEAAPTLEVLRAQTTVPLPLLSSVAPDVPAPLRDAIARCIDPDPDQRPASAAEVAGVFAPFLGRVSSDAVRNLRGAGILIIVPALALTAMVALVVVQWIVPEFEMPSRRYLARRAKMIVELTIAFVASIVLLLSAIAAAARALLRERQGGTATRGDVVAALQTVFAAPKWWPTWYPGSGVPDHVQRLPESIQSFRAYTWWILPPLLGVGTFAALLALSPKTMLSLRIARWIVGLSLAGVVLFAFLLGRIVLDYRRSPTYDVFELAEVALVRVPVMDVARAFPALSETDAGPGEAFSLKRWAHSRWIEWRARIVSRDLATRWTAQLYVILSLLLGSYALLLLFNMLRTRE